MRKIFVNGTFDLVHYGHISLLKYARSLGDHLLVALDSDQRVKFLKGEGRPVNDIFQRLTLIRNLKFVDNVVAFGSDDDLKRIVRSYKPDITVRGSDHSNSEISHGTIVFFDRIPTYSSTNIIQKISGNSL
jgi:D-beta-D-heptose 7-phosphate kinase/D-beta-D-heptose 1-phosphate adenosyltransferase